MSSVRADGQDLGARFDAPLRRRTARRDGPYDDRLPEMLPDVGRTREELDLRRGIGRERGAGARRPQIGSNQRDFEEDVEKREDDDGDHAPGGSGQSFESDAIGDRRVGHQDAAILVGCAPADRRHASGAYDPRADSGVLREAGSQTRSRCQLHAAG